MSNRNVTDDFKYTFVKRSVYDAKMDRLNSDIQRLKMALDRLEKRIGHIILVSEVTDDIEGLRG